MKKIFFLMVLLTFSVVVSAQTKVQRIEAPAGANIFEKSPKKSILSVGHEKRYAPQRKIDLSKNERLVGFYTTDDLPDFTEGGIGLNNTTTVYVANDFDEEVLGDFVNGQITRMRFSVACDSVQVYDAFVYSLSGTHLTLESSAEINEYLDTGWYEVELTEPVTIEEGLEYFVGFAYYQIYGEYPIATDVDLERDIERDEFYYYTAANGSWYSVPTWGALCLQIVVSGDIFIDDDLALNKLSISKFTSKDSELPYNFQIKNMGNNIPESYSLKLSIDGTEVTTLNTPITLTNNYQKISGAIDVNSLSAGSHTMSVSVDKINGEVPTENISNDEVEASFVVYDGEMPERQMHLIENFTSIRCGNCPMGHAVLAAMQEDYPDKYAWVAIHSIGMGTDTLSLYTNTYLAVETFLGVTGYPEATFDRAALTNADLGLNGDYVVVIGYDTEYSHRVAGDLDEAIEAACEGVPAFVNINITPEYNSDTRELKVVVSGEGCTSADQLLEGNRLTVYLTENGIAGTQEDYNNGSYRNGYFVDYTHNNVLRAIPTTYEWGDDINWTSDNSYENTITTTLDSKWDDGQIYITAFISGPMATLRDNTWYYNTISEGMVNNVNHVKATDVPAGISTVTVDLGDKTPTYYTIDGRQLSTPVKGVNIIRNNDGSVKKLYVK